MTTAAFVLWPLVGLVFFLTMRLPVAVAATLIGGYLLLPPGGGVDLPLLPTVNKNLVASLTALVLGAIFAGRSGEHHLPGWVPRSPVILGLMALLVAGTFATVFTNGDTVVYGRLSIPGLRLFDAFAEVQVVLVTLLPFLIARKFFATPENQKTLLLVLAVAALGYSLLALYEVRMSPQLNNKVYGFFPHQWNQHVRAGGFRPVVFLSHGLLLSIFFACATLAAFGLWRIEGGSRRGAYLAAGLWLLMTLVLSKSLGALAATLLLLPVLLFLPYRLHILAAAVVSVALLTYPVLRAGGLVPTDQLVSAAASLSEDRSRSLQFRFMNEDILLAKASERPLFGWGGWGRSRVFDPESGEDISVTDGRWVITFGQSGWVGYVGEFGLLTFAVLALALRRRALPLAPPTAILSLVLAVNLLDLIPNAGLTQITFLLAGALAGRLELGRAAAGAAPDEAGPAPAPTRGGFRRAPGDGAAPVAARAAEPAEGRGAARFSRFAPKPGRTT